MTEPRKSRQASWRELPPAEMAAHLLATPTISDRAWTSEPRLPRETRDAFVRRVLLAETPEAEPQTGEAEAAEPAVLGETPESNPETLRPRPQSRLTRSATSSTLMGATPGTRWAERRLVSSCERAIWSPSLESQKRSALPPTTWRSTRR
jgi:hypothetical protein